MGQGSHSTRPKSRHTSGRAGVDEASVLGHVIKEAGLPRDLFEPEHALLLLQHPDYSLGVAASQLGHHLRELQGGHLHARGAAHRALATALAGILRGRRSSKPGYRQSLTETSLCAHCVSTAYVFSPALESLAPIMLHSTIMNAKGRMLARAAWVSPARAGRTPGTPSARGTVPACGPLAGPLPCRVVVPAATAFRFAAARRGAGIFAVYSYHANSQAWQAALRKQGFVGEMAPPGSRTASSSSPLIRMMKPSAVAE